MRAADQRRRIATVGAALTLGVGAGTMALGGAAAGGATASRHPTASHHPTASGHRGPDGIVWPSKPSIAVGKPYAGRLVRGVQLPAQGRDFVTWDQGLLRRPDRPWRRWGTDRLVRRLLRVLRQYRAAHPEAPRVVVGDLSRPHGGNFSKRYGGGHGHVSHQNGLDVDIYYPRKDRHLRPPFFVDQINHRLAQDLVNRFARAGAKYVFVGLHTHLGGRPGIVEPLGDHEDQFHFRLAGPGSG